MDTKKTVKSPVKVVGYKGFNEQFQCTPDGKVFQYEVGKTYTHDGAPKICNSGFHFCENPLDVLNYYPPTGRFAEVEGEDCDKKTDDDSKRSAKRLTIKAEVSLTHFLGAGVKFILDKVDWTNSPATNTGAQSAATNTGYQSAATNTGAQSAATNTGYQSAATNTGARSAATNTGDRSAATNTGDRSAATNTGYQSAATNTGAQSAATNTGAQSAATNTGDQSAATNTGAQSAATNTGARSAATNTGAQSAATNTGYQSAATNTGARSAATNTGDRSAATNTGVEGCAVCLGIEGKARGAVGCWLTLAEWKEGKDYVWHRIDVQTAKVDGKVIKADVFYVLQGGKFVEAA